MIERQVRLVRDLLPFARRVVPPAEALRAAVDWLYRAQDASPDRGVSHSYLLGTGWMKSYPETTGYIIPTLLNWARKTGEEEARARALEMCDWECGIQDPGGGIQASVVGVEHPKPVVFNTGQVIFGWVSAFRETGVDAYLEAAARAVRWLVDCLGDQNTWLTHGSMGADQAHTYNVRVAWAILEYSRITDGSGHQTMRKVVTEALRQERADGWFEMNCLTDHERPLLHTIAYTARGLLECGILLEDQRAMDAAMRTADALGATIRKNGSMAGRYGPKWQAAVSWSCLTGMAQIAIVWLKLGAMTGKEKYRAWADRVNRFLCTVLDADSGNPGIRGGLPGSFPINGEYGRYRILNWATKFFVDALLLQQHPELVGAEDYYPG